MLMLGGDRAGARASAAPRALASAYGVSVTGTMLIDTLLLFIVAARDAGAMARRWVLAAVRRCS